MNISTKRLIMAGIPAGIIWGWLSMTVNSVSGTFEFEGSFTHDLTTFAVGGAVFGVLVAGLLSLIGDKLPFKSRLSSAVFVSTSLWLLLRTGGTLLSHMDTDRYHIVTTQTIQGFFLAIILGCILWPFWKNESKEQIEQRR